jgi:hypothetical protein
MSPYALSIELQSTDMHLLFGLGSHNYPCCSRVYSPLVVLTACCSRFFHLFCSKSLFRILFTLVCLPSAGTPVVYFTFRPVLYPRRSIVFKFVILCCFICLILSFVLTWRHGWVMTTPGSVVMDLNKRYRDVKSFGNAVIVYVAVTFPLSSDTVMLVSTA